MVFQVLPFLKEAPFSLELYRCLWISYTRDRFSLCVYVWACLQGGRKQENHTQKRRKVSKLWKQLAEMIACSVACALVPSAHPEGAPALHQLLLQFPRRCCNDEKNKTCSLPSKSILFRGEKCRYGEPEKVENGILNILWPRIKEGSLDKMQLKGSWSDTDSTWQEVASWMPLNHHSSTHAREGGAGQQWPWRQKAWTGTSAQNLQELRERGMKTRLRTVPVWPGIRTPLTVCGGLRKHCVSESSCTLCLWILMLSLSSLQTAGEGYYNYS